MQAYQKVQGELSAATKESEAVVREAQDEVKTAFWVREAAEKAPREVAEDALVQREQAVRGQEAPTGPRGHFHAETDAGV